MPSSWTPVLFPLLLPANVHKLVEVRGERDVNRPARGAGGARKRVLFPLNDTEIKLNMRRRGCGSG